MSLAFQRLSSLGKALHPRVLHFTQVNEYLAGRSKMDSRRQNCRAGVLPRKSKWHTNEQVQWPGGGCETSFWNMVWVRNVFLKYGLGAKRLSEIWFGCETSSWTMKTGAKRLFYLWGGGKTSFLSMSWGRNVSLKNGANWLWGEKSVYPRGYWWRRLSGLQTWYLTINLCLYPHFTAPMVLILNGIYSLSSWWYACLKVSSHKTSLISTFLLRAVQ